MHKFTIKTTNQPKYHCNDIPFLIDDIFQSWQNLFFVQRSKAEACASRLKCRYDFAQVIANDAESNIVGVFFNDYK